MTLSRKIVALFLLFIAALTAIFLIISQTIWHEGYKELERREVFNETRRVQLALKNEQDRLHTLAQDWGPWDETYAFAHDLSDSFVQKNLTEPAMSNLNVSYVLITSPDGRALFELALDLKTGKYTKPMNGQSAIIAALSSRIEDPDKGLTGIVRLNDGTPLMVTSSQILTSEHEGPTRGTLWFARTVDDDYLTDLSDLTQSNVSLAKLDDPAWEEKADTVNSRWLFPVLNELDPYMFCVTVSRDIVRFGEKQRNEFFLIIIATSLLFLLLALTAIDRLLLRRLRLVSQFFKELAEQPKLSRRLELTEQNDELNQIARSVNRLLTRLENAQARVRSLFQAARRELHNRKQAERQLKHLSRHDALTGLFNRLHFETEAIHLIELHHNLGLVICDVDGLKLVNDSFGHAAGDALLRRAAELLRRIFPTPCVICRIGGDEFAILWPEASLVQLEETALELDQQLARQPQPTSSDVLGLHMSIGYRHITGEELDTETFYRLFTSADDAMYRQKLSHEQSNRSALVQSMMSLLEARDYMTEGHSLRLQDMCTQLGYAAGLSNLRLDDLRLLAKFHDIGKIGIPDQVLFKNGPLTEEEWVQMRRHSEIGNRIARHIPDLSAIAGLILHHHERWDGKGYPLGLAGEGIPLESRILALIDAYDAMTNDRPYRKALSHETAIAEIHKNRGIMFDPTLTDLFLKLYQKTAGSEPNTD